MVEEIGVVTSVDGQTARVNVPKKSACSGCTAGVCVAGEQSMEIIALNKAGAKAGQKVRVSVHSNVYMKSAMIIYGIPSIALVLGAVFGKEVMPGVIRGTDPDVLSAIFGFGFLGLSFVFVKIWAGRKIDKAESSPVIEEIIS
jgi:sigma-E factor negative regulatory protein RseC